MGRSRTTTESGDSTVVVRLAAAGAVRGYAGGDDTWGDSSVAEFTLSEANGLPQNGMVASAPLSCSTGIAKQDARIPEANGMKAWVQAVAVVSLGVLSQPHGN